MTTTAVVHGQEWFEVEVTIPIGGSVIRRRWCAKAQTSQRPQSVLSRMISSRSLLGDIITESTDFSSLTPYN
jgi:hypothetical protein